MVAWLPPSNRPKYASGFLIFEEPPSWLYLCARRTSAHHSFECACLPSFITAFVSSQFAGAERNRGDSAIKTANLRETGCSWPLIFFPSLLQFSFNSLS